MAFKAVIAGASGLIGGLLLEQLLRHSEYNEVFVLVRRKLNLQHHKLTRLIVDFNRLDGYQNEINGPCFFLLLGINPKKNAQLEAYYTIDNDFPLHLAKIAAKNSMQQFHLVSALGANVNSSTFYIKLKGETEADLKKVKIESIYIYQPSLLIGNRQEKRIEERFAGSLAKWVDPLLLGRFKKYRSIPAETVAKAMLNQSLKNNSGIFTYPSDQIKKLA